MSSRQIIAYFHYNDKDGGRPRNCRVDDFNVNTSQAEIEQCVLDKLQIERFYLEIEDSRKQLIDFNHESIESFLRHASQYQIDTTGVQPANSEPIIINLYITETSKSQSSSRSTSDSQRRAAIAQKCASSHSLVGKPDDKVEKSSHRNLTDLICADGPISFKNKDRGIEFKVNLNETLRDEYRSNSTTVSNDQQKGLPIRMQGNKKKLKGNDIHQSVLPMVQIDSKKIFPGEKNVKCNLVCCFVQECCENGKRVLYYHPVYVFVDDNKVKTSNQPVTTDDFGSSSIKDESKSKRHVILPYDPKMLSKEGYKIDLKLMTIIGTKTRPNQSKQLFCELADQCHKDANYKTNRLAILIEHNGRLLWDQLLFSNGVVFCHSKKQIELYYYKLLSIAGLVIEEIPMCIPVTRAQLSELEDRGGPPPTKRIKTSSQQTSSSRADGYVLPMRTASSDQSIVFDEQPAATTMMSVQVPLGTLNLPMRASTSTFDLNGTAAELPNNPNLAMNIGPTSNILGCPQPIAQDNSQGTGHPIGNESTILNQQEDLWSETIDDAFLNGLLETSGVLINGDPLFFQNPGIDLEAILTYLV